MTSYTAAAVDTGPIYVDGMDAAEYHAHPALSSSQARDLLRTPALYRWRKDHPIVPTREMELGTCVHTIVLRTGQGYEVCEHETRQTKAAKDEIAEIESRGLIALRPSEYDAVSGMANLVRAHPLAGPLLHHDRGTAERALFWRDEKTGVDCRALVDFSPHNRRSLVDLKTIGNANPAELGKHMARFGYPIQGRFYIRGALALGLIDEDAEFVWVFVEREPPHGVVVCRLPAVDMAWADERVGRALEIYRDCDTSGIWPGYPEDLITVALPGWARREYEEEQTW